LSRALLNDQLRALWARLRGQPASGAAADFLPLDGEAAARRQIRARYQAFLAAMATRNRPRPPGATPEAYSTQLAELTAAQIAALHTLTNAYVAVRYGDAQPDAAQLAQSEVDWRKDEPANREGEGRRDKES